MDPDGKYIETIWDVVSISIGVKNLRQNIKAGNIKAAVGDGVGILIDGLAAVIPVIPGGVGATRTVGKVAINAADGAIDAAKAADTAKDAGKVVKNPFGSKGKLDHRNKVEELAGKAERHPESKRNRLREEEYDRLGIEHETHSLN